MALDRPMSNRYLLVAALLPLWVSIAALAYVVIRELGWQRLKRYTFAWLCVALSLASFPAAGFLKVAWPYKDRILAKLIRRESPAVVLSAGCSVFPANNIWNTSVRNLPLDPHWQNYLQTMGPNQPLHADFTLPFAFVAGGAPTASVDLGGNSESDPGPYRIPDNAPIELGEDAHVLVLDSEPCRLYELYAAKHVGEGRWEAGTGAIFDLRSNKLRPQGWTSADASGLPILPGLVRYDEVASGHIRHALRFSTRLTRRAFIWPARHFASRSEDPNLPPMGLRVRLRDSFDTAGLSPEAQVILTALKEYGMFLADNGGNWFLSGAIDSRWSSRLAQELKKVTGSDFEAVDSTSLMKDPDSAEVRP